MANGLFRATAFCILGPTWASGVPTDELPLPTRRQCCSVVDLRRRAYARDWRAIYKAKHRVLGLAHRAEALAHALRGNRGLDTARYRPLRRMYVHAYTSTTARLGRGPLPGRVVDARPCGPSHSSPCNLAFVAAIPELALGFSSRRIGLTAPTPSESSTVLVSMTRSSIRNALLEYLKQHSSRCRGKSRPNDALQQLRLLQGRLDAVRDIACRQPVGRGPSCPGARKSSPISRHPMLNRRERDAPSAALCMHAARWTNLTILSSALIWAAPSSARSKLRDMHLESPISNHVAQEESRPHCRAAPRAPTAWRDFHRTLRVLVHAL